MGDEEEDEDNKRLAIKIGIIKFSASTHQNGTRRGRRGSVSGSVHAVVLRQWAGDQLVVEPVLLDGRQGFHGPGNVVFVAPLADGARLEGDRMRAAGQLDDLALLAEQVRGDARVIPEIRRRNAADN